MSRSTNLMQTLDAIKKGSDGDKVSFDNIVKALNHRGFGSVLIGPALITFLPTGAIPGIPALCGIFIALISIQMVVGKSYPWLPKQLKEMSFDRKKYLDVIEKVEPYIKRIDRFFHPRFEFLTSDFLQRCGAVVCFILALVMIFAGFIPFLPMLPALTILIFGLSMSVHDGLLAAIGGLFLTVTCIVVPWLIINFMG